MRKARAVLLAAALSAALHAEITFSMPELDSGDGILFSVTHKQPGEASYSTLFTADLSRQESARQITAFPEELSLLSGGKTLRIRNRYGVSHYSVETGSLTHTSSAAKEYIPSAPVLHGAESVSPDGKWICSVEKTGAATARITLKNATGYTEAVLVPSAELSYTSVPVRWSPDGSLLIYEKNGSVYFTEPEAVFQTSQIPESLRRIGSGTISSVQWASERSLVYISSDLVYRIPVNEMYTRALYSDFVGTGTIIGRLPFALAPSDKYSVSGDCKRLVHIRGNRTVSYMSLPGSAEFAAQLHSRTVTAEPAELIEMSVFWTAASVPVIWTQHHRNGRSEGTAVRLSDRDGAENAAEAVPLATPRGASVPLLSPDGRSVFFTDGSKAYVYALAPWEETASAAFGKLSSCVWADSSTLYLGGPEAVRRWSAAGGSSQILFPCSGDSYGWNPGNGRPAVKAEGEIFEYDGENSRWEKSAMTELPTGRIRNDKYRTFLGTSPNKDFANAPYVRTLTGPAVTRVMYTPAAKQKNPRPKAALVFDATDNADGLPAILRTLDRYGLKATFFINGEFLRRYPAETIRIAQAGHECGSMFHTATDLTAPGNFVVDEDFVRRGLARNEDEFFDRTGRELALVWHAPYHKANRKIIRAGSLAGYAYVEGTVPPHDTLTMEEAVATGAGYMPAAQIIEAAAKRLRPDAVIPVSTGVSGGTRGDYLYDKLDLLIGAILDAGYDIVTAGSLHAPGLPAAGTSPRE